MAAEEKKPAAEDKLPVAVRAQMLSNETSIYFNMAKFEHAQRLSSMFATSTMVPEHFRNSVGNCMIALNYADRLQADPFMVMQSMYVVHGRPGIEAKLMIALINQSGKYSEPLKFKFDGAGEEYGCTAFTREAKSGEVVEGPKVTWKIVKAEGWESKNGSKWKTIPDLMFRYRAASWFSNVHCPELKLGMSTVEEIRDFVDLQESKPGKWTPPATIEQEPDSTFSEAFSKYVEKEYFVEFVTATATANRCTRNEIVRAANADPESFIRTLEAWLKKRNGNGGASVPPVEAEQPEPDSGRVKRSYTRRAKQETSEEALAQDHGAAELAELQARIAGMDKLLVDQAVINSKINPDAEWTIDGCLAVIEEVSRLRRVTERR